MICQSRNVSRSMPPPPLVSTFRWDGRDFGANYINIRSMFSLLCSLQVQHGLHESCAQSCRMPPVRRDGRVGLYGPNALLYCESGLFPGQGASSVFLRDCGWRGAMHSSRCCLQATRTSLIFATQLASTSLLVVPCTDPILASLLRGGKVLKSCCSCFRVKTFGFYHQLITTISISGGASRVHPEVLDRAHRIHIRRFQVL